MKQLEVRSNDVETINEKNTFEKIYSWVMYHSDELPLVRPPYHSTRIYRHINIFYRDINKSVPTLLNLWFLNICPPPRVKLFSISIYLSFRYYFYWNCTFSPGNTFEVCLALWYNIFNIYAGHKTWTYLPLESFHRGQPLQFGVHLGMTFLFASSNIENSCQWDIKNDS